MELFTWSLNIDELNPQKWGNIYRQYLDEGFTLEYAKNELSKYIDKIYNDFGISPKDNNWTIIIHLQHLKLYNQKTGETRFENGSYISN
jgi:hypothetical protein